jgi:hypothetical protein
VKTQKRNVQLSLTDFVIPPDDVPEEVRRGVKHWSQWIDYWAVDWDGKGDAFHNEWQTYRTRKDNKLVLETEHRRMPARHAGCPRRDAARITASLQQISKLNQDRSYLGTDAVS